ncbi:efflux RND transporter periplasmic adaptor subunit [Mesorhizobium xinjiangense]|uniref:efflux RND transporter periplasmic adaptor subunit n=1 Tax=Mesorhizobium xinjiangense TaxID=2678685 RepID=UPI0012EE2E91|nr:efflux RND transporter periplasmic adaptor subunit [Mesorhizobium xinjiangense]
MSTVRLAQTTILARIVGILVGLLLLGGLAHGQQAPAPAVVVAPAQTMDLRETADFTGRVVAIQKVDIRARVSGFLEAINFTEGAKVAEGTVLYEVEDGSYRAAVQEIEGQIEAAEAARKLAELERDRMRNLVARQAVSQAQFDTAQAELGKAEGNLKQLHGAKDAAELNLSYTSILAPFDGLVGLSAPDVGALVGPDSGALTTLTRLEPINVEFPVATALYLQYRERQAKGELKGGADVTITLPDGTEYPSKGTINFVSSTVARGTDTVTVRAQFDNSNGELLHDALVRVMLEQSEPEDVLAIPQQAIQRDQLGAFVMVVKDDSTVEQRRVDVSRTTKGQAVIAGGLKEGEKVITDGVGKVRPGIKVDASEAKGS